jgi:hypothetical protein
MEEGEKSYPHSFVGRAVVKEKKTGALFILEL